MSEAALSDSLAQPICEAQAKSEPEPLNLRAVAGLTLAALSLAVAPWSNGGCGGRQSPTADLSAREPTAADPRCGTGKIKKPECIECQSAHCGEAVATCFGTDWQRGDWSGGSCEPFSECADDCGCTDRSCALGCLEDVSEQCFSCMMDLGMCLMSWCAEPCDETSEPATSSQPAMPPPE